MDKQELNNKLELFKRTCSEKGYIEDGIVFEEAYPGMIPSSFIVDVLGKQDWVDKTYSGLALKQLIQVLWETTDANIRENIFTIRISGKDERQSMELQ